LKILLDTCAFLWIASDDKNLSAAARDCFQDTGNEVWLSAASEWEIVVKHGAKKLVLPEPPDDFLPARRRAYGISALAISEEAVLRLARLPGLHKDPFDRMLVCQAIVEGCVILTPDPLIRQYPVRCEW